MPNIDEIVDGISQIIADRKAGVYILQHRISLMRTDKYHWNKRPANTAIFHLSAENRREHIVLKKDFTGSHQCRRSFKKSLIIYLRNFPGKCFHRRHLNCVKGNKRRAHCISGKYFEEVKRIKCFLKTTEMGICKNRM